MVNIVNYFCRKAPSYILSNVLNTLLSVAFLNSCSEMCQKISTGNMMDSFYKNVALGSSMVFVLGSADFQYKPYIIK